VSSYARRQSAEDAAHRVAGVLDVANEIEVHPPPNLLLTDEEIAHAVRHALEWDVTIPDERIVSSVAQGWVTLERKLDQPFERGAVEKVVRNPAGVRGVTNHIGVAAPSVEAYNLASSGRSR
jgi:osmotically-inducible protein OsmY